MDTARKRESVGVVDSSWGEKRALRLAASTALASGLILGVIWVVSAGGPGLAGAGDRAAQADGDARWLSETVDGAGVVGEHISLAVDGDGNPHIGYHRQIPNQLKYARLSGASWTIEVVDDNGRPGLYTSLVLAPVSPYTPHISYYEAYGGDLRYAWRTSSGWVTQTVAGGIGAYSAVALEPAPPYTPHLAFRDDDGDALMHAWLSGTIWYSEVVESRPGYVPNYISLALAPASPYTPHISYQDGQPYYDLKHAWWTPGGWLSETVDSDGNVGSYSSIALEPALPYTPHISHYESTTGIQDLKHAWWTSGGWLSETVDAEGNVGRYSSLALEQTAPYTPHIAYYDETNDDLRHAGWTSTGWLTETVESEGEVGKYCSLGLAPMAQNALHIAYYDGANHDLKHAWFGREFQIYLPLALKRSP